MSVSDIQVVLNEVYDELKSATEKFGPFRVPHEGYAVILEELDELWDAIKDNQKFPEHRKECIQIAAMAIRYVLDLCEGP